MTGLVSIAATVVGGVSARTIAHSGGRLKRRGMDVFGFVAGIVASAVCMIATLAYFSLFHQQ